MSLTPKAHLFASQDRNDDGLQNDDGEGHEAQPDVLHQDEQQGGQGLGAEKGWLDEGVADEAADRLDFIVNHRGRFGRFDGADFLRLEAEEFAQQLVAQPAQHALSEDALAQVDDILEGAVDEHQQQVNAAQSKEKSDLVELGATNQPVRKPVPHRGRGHGSLAGREGTTLQGFVDDPLGDFQRRPVERQRQYDQQQNRDLFALAVSPDEAENALFQIRSPPRCRFGVVRQPARAF